MQIGCSGGGDDAGGADFGSSTEGPGGREVHLMSALGTTQSGRVNFSAEGDSLLVAVELAGVGSGTHRGFIRHGESCEAPGAAIVELPGVIGAAEGPAAARGYILVPELPDSRALVVYHEPNQTPGHVILCGLITPGAFEIRAAD